MKKFLATIFLPFLFYSCTIHVDDLSFDDADFRVEETESSVFSSAQIREVEVKTQNGAIESSVWDDDSIQIVYEKWATGHNKSDAASNLQDIRISVDEDVVSGVLDV